MPTFNAVVTPRSMATTWYIHLLQTVTNKHMNPCGSSLIPTVLRRYKTIRSNTPGSHALVNTQF